MTYTEIIINISRMEHFVKHIGLQPGVTAVSWKIIDIDSILMPYAEA